MAHHERRMNVRLAAARASYATAPCTPQCVLPWTLLAAAWREQSGGGRSHGRAVNSEAHSIITQTPWILDTALNVVDVSHSLICISRVA